MTDVYFWCDLETTGLDPAVCSITEIAVILTKGPETGFEEIDRYHRGVRNVSPLWQATAYEMAKASGLLSPGGELAAGLVTVSSSDLGGDLSRLIAKYDRPILAARNTAFERGFLAAHAPGVARRLHYREFDVTPLFLIDPDLYNYEHGVTGTPHRAMYDIERDLEYAREFARRYHGGGQ